MKGVWVDLKCMLISRRNTRYQLGNGSSEEGLGLDLRGGHKRHLIIQIRQNILEVAEDRPPLAVQGSEAVSSCPD